jgi:hypothetical protein
MNVAQQGYYVYQSVTNFLFFTPYFGAFQPAMLSVCFCATNYCNANMSTCTVGLNYSYTTLYGVNATNPTTMTASSSSGMTTGSNVSNTITIQLVMTTAATKGNILCILKVIFEPYSNPLRLFSHKQVTFSI